MNSLRAAENNSAEIRTSSLPDVQALGKALSDANLKGSTFIVAGHTDAVGSEAFNQDLSERRAESVRDYFVQQGIQSSAIEAHGFGKTDPIASNDTPEGRQQNRRVELVLSGDAIGGAIDESISENATAQNK